MTDQHPITPPPELVQQWLEEIWHEGTPVQVAASDLHIATQAARWGSDQELEACCEHLKRIWSPSDTIDELRAARRSKPPSLKEQALQAAQRFYAKGHENCTDEEVKDDFDTIRRALEQLDG